MLPVPDLPPADDMLTTWSQEYTTHTHNIIHTQAHTHMHTHTHTPTHTHTHTLHPHTLDFLLRCGFCGALTKKCVRYTCTVYSTFACMDSVMQLSKNQKLYTHVHEQYTCTCLLTNSIDTCTHMYTCICTTQHRIYMQSMSIYIMYMYIAHVLG